MSLSAVLPVCVCVCVGALCVSRGGSYFDFTAYWRFLRNECEEGREECGRGRGRRKASLLAGTRLIRSPPC